MLYSLPFGLFSTGPFVTILMSVKNATGNDCCVLCNRALCFQMIGYESAICSDTTGLAYQTLSNPSKVTILLDSIDCGAFIEESQ